MTSLPIRNPQEDHLLTPKNSVLILIDYQPPQIFTTKSMDRQQMINNVVALTKIAKNFGLPIILTTVNVTNGVNPDTIPQLRSVIPEVRSIDRTTINSWEDEQFLKAVKATGRKKLIMAALWTEACLIFPAIDALKEGYEVYPVIDALGGTSVESHRAALDRASRAGAQLTTWNSVGCELQRDWARKKPCQAGSRQISSKERRGVGISRWSVKSTSSTITFRKPPGKPKSPRPLKEKHRREISA